MFKSTKNKTNKPALFYCIAIITSLSLFSCGPRTGTHENEETEQANDKAYENLCGNAVTESRNYGMASNKLKVSGDGENGRKLFKQNCAVCHTVSHSKLTGPGLAGVYNRIPEPKTKWLRNYILNNQKVHKSGDNYAKKLGKEYGIAGMTIFEGVLSDQEVDDLMIYLVGSSEQEY